jgi:hypothetical protein
MAAEDVFRSLSSHWAETAGYLTPEDVRLVRQTARLTAAAAAAAAAGTGTGTGTGTGDTREARAAMLRLTTVLYDRLPAGHPVSVAISGGTLLAGPASPDSQLRDVAASLEAITALTLLSQADDDDGPPPAAGPADPADPDEVADRLLAAPALTGQQVRDGGADPGEPGLIRLDRPDGRQQIPAFQFSQAGTPIAVVLTINRLLDADDDPFGVADWWLGRNAWLDAIPADLIGQVDDALLVRAARAELDVG